MTHHPPVPARRVRRGMAVLPAVLGSLLLFAPDASADPVADATAALRTGSVYLDPASNRNVDLAVVRAAIGDQPIKIAIIPVIPSVSEVAVLPRQLARDLPGNTIAVISGRYFYAGSEVVCKGIAGQAAANAINANEQQLDANPSADSPSDITKALTDFVAEVGSARRCPQEPGRGDRYADEPGGGVAAAGTDDTASVLPWVAGGVGTGVLAVGAFVLLARHSARSTSAQHRQQAADLVHRLAGELDRIAPGAGPAAEHRAEAAGRHGEAEAILLGATTDEQFTAARRAAIEGLTAARAARLASGQEPGADIPGGQPTDGKGADRG